MLIKSMPASLFLDVATHKTFTLAIKADIKVSAFGAAVGFITLKNSLTIAASSWIFFNILNEG